MPALFDDPTAPVIYRTSGLPPFPSSADPQIPPSIVPRHVTLRDRITIATLLPFYSSEVPPSLLMYLCDQMNREIEKGDTYPMIEPMSPSSFGDYWFANFGAIMLLGDISSIDEVQDMERAGRDWSKYCLGSFHIKPNYPGRSSHVCNGAFLVTDGSRNRGVGRLMGEVYLEWAPQLGYKYSVFNLVYETNVASCRIWDALGFKRIGRVPGCGSLRSYPGEYVDAIIYGRDLGPEGEDFVSEERFDKIRFYLKHGKYPNGADRAEKSRLRSAATHYKLILAEDGEGEKLMLKDKEVVSDPQKQYEIARNVHLQQHGGINKTTATIALKYHWVRIKETVSMVIKNCPECKETPKAPPVHPEGQGPKLPKDPSPREDSLNSSDSMANALANEMTNNMTFTDPHDQLSNGNPFDTPHQYAVDHQQQMNASVGTMADYDIPLDPQIMQDIQNQLPRFQHHDPSSDPYVHSQHHHGTHGLPDFTTMHQHHHSDDYQMGDDDEVIAAQATAALQQQQQAALGLVDAADLDSEELKQQLLAAGFGERDANRHFGP